MSHVSGVGEGGRGWLPHEVSQLNQLLSIPLAGGAANPGPLFNGGNACHLSETNGHSILKSQNLNQFTSQTFVTKQIILGMVAPL